MNCLRKAAAVTESPDHATLCTGFITVIKFKIVVCTNVTWRYCVSTCKITYLRKKSAWPAKCPFWWTMSTTIAIVHAFPGRWNVGLPLLHKPAKQPLLHKRTVDWTVPPLSLSRLFVLFITNIDLFVIALSQGAAWADHSAQVGHLHQSSTLRVSD